MKVQVIIKALDTVILLATSVRNEMVITPSLHPEIDREQATADIRTAIELRNALKKVESA